MWLKKKILPTSYKAKVGCFNCDHMQIINVKLGIPVDKFCVDGKLKCDKCQCIETIQSWTQYKAGKAMMNQIMQMAKAEEEISSKGHKHYG